MSAAAGLLLHCDHFFFLMEGEVPRITTSLVIDKHDCVCRCCAAAVLLLQCDHFFFLMEGEVQLQRGGVNLGTLIEGSFVVR
jgi:hypothetical protein